MRLLADENCDRLLVSILRQDGHDVLYVVESMRGTSDLELFKLAHAEDRVIVTDDLDFGHISKSDNQRPPAVIIARLDELS